MALYCFFLPIKREICRFEMSNFRNQASKKRQVPSLTRKMSGTTETIEPMKAVFEQEALANFRNYFLKDKERRILKVMKDPYS